MNSREIDLLFQIGFELSRLNYDQRDQLSIQIAASSVLSRHPDDTLATLSGEISRDLDESVGHIADLDKRREERQRIQLAVLNEIMEDHPKIEAIAQPSLDDTVVVEEVQEVNRKTEITDPRLVIKAGSYAKIEPKIGAQIAKKLVQRLIATRIVSPEKPEHWIHSLQETFDRIIESPHVQRQLRFEAFRSKAVTSAKISGATSLIFNIGQLLNGEIFQYAMAVGRDASIAGSTAAIGTAMESSSSRLINRLSPAASVIVLGAVDAIRAYKNGDYHRLGLNIALNGISTGGSLIGTALGSEAVAFFGIINPMATGAILFLGAVATGMSLRYAADKTRLGAMTEREKTEAMGRIRREMNKKLEQFGVELDREINLDKFIQMRETGQISLKPLWTTEHTEENLFRFMGEKNVYHIMRIASTLDDDYEAGLGKILRMIVKCSGDDFELV